MYDQSMFSEPGYSSGQSFEREPLGVYTAKTFGWMALGLFTTFALSFVMSVTPIAYALFSVPALPFLLLILEVVVVIALSAKVHKISVGAARGLFFLYSALNAVTFSAILLTYSLGTLIFVFGLTALYFGVLAAYGYFTKRDLSNLRTFLLFGLAFLAIYWLISLFLPMTGFDRIACLIGIVVFMGFTAYDTQKIKAFYYSMDPQSDMGKKMSIISALELYLDFVNLFLYILRLVGVSRD